LTGCQDAVSDHLEFDGRRAYDLAAEQLDFGARHPGSSGHRQTGDWILQELEEAGWKAFEQPFTFDEQPLRNLIGRAGPADGSIIILGAHYDTRPVADADPDNPTEPVPGANDGASGVSVLLELARVLRIESMCNQVWLVFFDAEDSGNLDGWDWAMGSAYFVEVMQFIPQAVVVVDMIGDADLQIYYEHNSDAALSQDIWALAAQLGNTAFIPELRHAMMDDHTAFVLRGIPAVDIIDFDYPAWHTTRDTLDQISAESLEQVGRTLEVWVESCP
jgi:Zn-dependent M28 family amino/carboxypeptidase